MRIRLKDGTKLKGFLSRVSENDFAVSNEKTGVETEVSYSNAKQVKGNNLTTGDKIWIAVGITAVILSVAIIIAIKPQRCPCN